MLIERLPEAPGTYFCFGCEEQARVPTNPAAKVALMVEDARERLDTIIAGCDWDRPSWQQLTALDQLLRQVKAELGYPHAGLERYGCHVVDSRKLRQD